MATKKRITEARLELIGVRASQFVGKELRAAAMTAFKTKRKVKAAPVIMKMQPTVLRSFVAAHMLGVKKARAKSGLR